MAAAIAVMMIDFALISAAGNLNIENADPKSLEALMGGNIFSLFSLSSVSSRLGSFPNPSSLIAIDAVAMMGVLIFAAFYLLRMKLKLPLIAVAWVNATLWVVPMGVSLFMLRGNQSLEKVGGWLALELVAIFYAMLACFVFAGLQWAMSKKRVKTIDRAKKKSETETTTGATARPKVIEYPL
jgi:hypothetical protein